ncbi:hypothetical protein J4734_19825 [Klebsiella pneumoniae]|uniref:Uncharacterized protein n=1 Tax=Klebsiella pneumoniae TaxID=573 RepID=A0A939NQ15_KLEPN|nr:hypothetical protein [Klebsiella pneumoniae]
MVAERSGYQLDLDGAALARLAAAQHSQRTDDADRPRRRRAGDPRRQYAPRRGAAATCSHQLQVKQVMLKGVIKLTRKPRRFAQLSAGGAA